MHEAQGAKCAAMRLLSAMFGVALLALGVGAWGGDWCHDGHPGHGTLIGEPAHHDWGGHRGLNVRGPSLQSLAPNAPLHEPHCHTLGLGYPDMSKAAVLEAAGAKNRGASKTSSIPLFAAVVETGASSVHARPFKPLGRFTPERDSQILVFLSTSRLLL